MLLSLCGFLKRRVRWHLSRICHVPSISTKSHITITRVRVINVRNNYILGAKEATLLNKLCLVRVMHWVCSELGFKPWVSDSESRVLFVKSFLFLLWITWEVECCLPSATLGQAQDVLWLACFPSVLSGLSTEAGLDSPGAQRTPQSRGGTLSRRADVSDRVTCNCSLSPCVSSFGL